MTEWVQAAGAAFWPLQVTSVWPSLAIMALLLALAGLIGRGSSFYRRLLDAETAAPRFHAIDGLRGFLALGVFFSHAVISHFFYETGRWVVPPSRFYTLAGQASVALFFMITAFLFWTKGLRARPFLPAEPFFWSRLVRLVPMYVFSVVCTFAVVLVVTRFEMKDSAVTLVKTLYAWLSFAFIEPGDINGLQRSWIVNSVYWSLRYEWLFYLLLPLMLLFARGRGFVLLAVCAAVGIHGFSNRPVELNFVFGALAAVLSDMPSLRHRIAWTHWSVSALVLGILAMLFTQFDQGYGWSQTALLFICFICIANGNSVFGLLTSRAARLLGSISYSIYLMHCIVLYLVLWTIHKFTPIGAMPAAPYWLLVAGCALLVVLLCSVTYRFIEHPWLKHPMPSWLGVAAGARRLPAAASHEPH